LRRQTSAYAGLSRGKYRLQHDISRVKLMAQESRVE